MNNVKNKLIAVEEEILQRYDKGNVSASQLAREYEVAASSMRQLLQRNGREVRRVFTEYSCNLTPVEAAYIAGILDGEGCLFARKVTSRGKVSIQGGIAVAMTSKAFLEELCRMTGVGKLTIQPVNLAKSEKWKPLWRWDISQQALIPLLHQVKPYMRLKQKRAELLLELAELKRQSTTLGAYRFERQLEICEAIQRMNQSGLEE